MEPKLTRGPVVGEVTAWANDVKGVEEMPTQPAQTPVMNSSQLAIIQGKTPKNYIKQRQGRGGKMLDYVEVGYVVQVLNEAFNFMWDFEVADQGVGKDQVWVKGILRIHITPEFSIKKSAFGGSEIKKWAAGIKVGSAMDIGDDLKAAAADALKKAASLVGVAGDVYYPQMDRLDEETAQISEADLATVLQKNKIFAMAVQIGNSAEEYKEKVKADFKLQSFNDLTKAQASQVIEQLNQEIAETF